MVSENNGSIVKEVLKNLCCNNGWSYGVFWSYNQQNPLLLTLQDEYHEDQTGFFIDNMLLQVHMFGEGVIGRAASTMKHQFIFSDAQIDSQDNSETLTQFLSGIKTISVIPVEQLGVVQFGSFQKVNEKMEFVEQTIALFCEMGNGGLIAREESSEILIPGGMFSSSISSDNHWPESTVPLSNLIWPSSFPSFDERIESMDNQINFNGCISSIQPQQSFLPSASYGNTCTDIAPCRSLWNTDDWFNTMGSDFWLSSGDTKLPSPQFNGDIFQEIDISNKLHQQLSTKPDPLLTETKRVSECNPSTSIGSSISNVFTTVRNNNLGYSISSGGIGSNKLFSSLGINKLLDDVSSSSCSVAKSSIEDQLSSANKRRRTDNPNRMSNVGSERDTIHRPLSDSSIKKPEQPAKNPKKKSKPGIRPRPKDRQQIADRLLELRKIIPNAEKMSIDCLLHRTIKHLLFLQSVSEHAESIKQLTDPKDRIVPRDITSSHDSGVTWACEVGDQTMVYPLIVEDLNTPGQMSIEIQCEEQDSFLEIVDIIRGFGLAILKGVMEAQKAKMCARFTVALEGKNHVTRHEIFSSLVQLLQFTSSTDQFKDVVSGGVGLFNTCQQSAIQLPV